MRRQRVDRDLGEMAEPKSAPAALLVYAAFSRYPESFDWLRRKFCGEVADVTLCSIPFLHDETDYYAKEMGTDLQKQLFVIDGLYDPARLADSKLQSNCWELEYAEATNFPEKRPLNIDPGYLTLGKFVLASAKDRAHRIYLHSGIYAEECLYYVAGWQQRPWTYPDYLRDDVQEFLTKVREQLKMELQQRAKSIGVDTDA